MAWHWVHCWLDTGQHHWYHAGPRRKDSPLIVRCITMECSSSERKSQLPRFATVSGSLGRKVATNRPQAIVKEPSMMKYHSHECMPRLPLRFFWTPYAIRPENIPAKGVAPNQNAEGDGQYRDGHCKIVGHVPHRVVSSPLEYHNDRYTKPVWMNDSPNPSKRRSTITEA